MANGEHVQMLLAATVSKDCLTWNQWRSDNPNLVPDLRGADLRNANLRCVDLSAADLRKADLSNAVLAAAKLGGTKLEDANLSGADLTGADLKCAHLMRADMTGADLNGADLRYADLRGTNFLDATLFDALVDPGALRRALNPSPGGPDRKRRGRKATVRPDKTVTLIRDNPLPGWVAAAARRLSKLGPALVKHEELTTLGLSGHEGSSPNRSGAPPNAADPRPDEPVK